jgi:ribosomal protein L7/L12
MRMSTVKFAKLIGNIERQHAINMTENEIEDIYDLIDVEVPVVTNKVAMEDVNELLRQIANPDGFIPAIKAYRVLTGAGLKESKEAIEKYRIIPKWHEKPAEATLGDILKTATS